MSEEGGASTRYCGWQSCLTPWISEGRQGNRFKTTDQTDGRSVGRMNERTNGQANNIKEKEKKNDTTTNRRYGTQSVPSGTCCCLSLPPLLQTQTRYERTCRLKDACPWLFHFDYFRLPVADATTTAVLLESWFQGLAWTFWTGSRICLTLLVRYWSLIISERKS